MHYDVAIIGGGVVGCALARELAKYQLRVILLERECEVGTGASKANSGIIHAGHRSAQESLKGELEWIGNQMWDQLHEELGFGFKRIGEMTVAMSEDDLSVLAALKAQGEAKGVPGLEIWGQERVRKEEPNLSDQVLAALYAPTSGVINPYEASIALAQSAKANGVEVSLATAVTGIESLGDHLVVRTDREPVTAKFVVNAAGVYGDKVAAMVGLSDFTIMPRKGEEYILDKRMAGIVRHTIFPCPSKTTKGILVIPTVDGTTMVGPTAHFVDDKEDRSTSAEGMAEVFSFVSKLVPAISRRDCIAQFAGLRPVIVETEDFLIGPTAVRGFINVAGIQSPGLTAAPAIALRVVEVLKSEGLPFVPNQDFNPRLPLQVRFAELSREEQRRLIEQDPSYGRIVCRCEHVTEGEILAAIRAGANTLDSLKFRTRTGMGRCQGGFCTARCMDLIAREVGIPITAVTKRGGASWLVVEPEGRS